MIRTVGPAMFIATTFAFPAQAQECPNGTSEIEFTKRYDKERDTTKHEPAETVVAGGVKMECSTVHHDVLQNLDTVLLLASATDDIIPGNLLWGASALDGTPSTVPGHRRPVTLYTDAKIEGGKSPAILVDNPNSATLTSAVSRLTERFDDRVQGQSVTVEAERVRSAEDILRVFKVSGSYRNVAGSLFSAAATSSSKDYFAIKITQTLFTISVADEELGAGAGAFFVDRCVPKDVVAAFNETEVPPVFVRNVTYGRVLYFVMEASELSTAEEVAGNIKAEFGLGDANSSWANAKERLSALTDDRLVAIGGSQQDALHAIRDRDFDLFFEPTLTTNARPISYRLQYISGRREPAKISSVLKYTVEECKPVGKTGRMGPCGDIGRVWPSGTSYLSDVPPCREEGIKGGYEGNRDTAYWLSGNQRVVIAGKEHVKSITMHPNAKSPNIAYAEWDLGKSASRFSVVMGLSEPCCGSKCGGAHVRMRVIVDGRTHCSQDFKKSTQSKTCEIGLGGAETLRLEVDGFSNLCSDHASWGTPAIEFPDNYE